MLVIVDEKAESIRINNEILRLQEITGERYEPVLLRCAKAQIPLIVDVAKFRRTSDMYEVEVKMRNMIHLARYQLCPSALATALPVRHLFSIAGGRATHIKVKTSPKQQAKRRIISPMKYAKPRELDITSLNFDVMPRPGPPCFAERWKMNWEIIGYRVAHAYNVEIMDNINGYTKHSVTRLIAKRVVASKLPSIRNIAPIETKILLRAPSPCPIALRTLDRGEPLAVKEVSIGPNKTVKKTEHRHEVKENSTMEATILSDALYDGSYPLIDKETRSKWFL
ncbi:hypothetical protein AB6A40_005535 [Gnathostoma spinigerum]|uniref:Uncharacterized protein n=1 Tax=Gnathostoma spinigerum TaxID=75299 RepID=A0ABD6EHX5_9BILA